MPISEDNLEYAVYLLGDLLLDSFGRFFPCGVRVSSTGRARQICSLTATKDLFNS
jgi:hypothetical protein